MGSAGQDFSYSDKASREAKRDLKRQRKLAQRAEKAKERQGSEEI
jgi:hypothetical protein